MTERTEQQKSTQKKYYNEKCKTSEAFIINRNNYNNEYYKKHSLDPKWREKRNQYYRVYYKKNNHYKKNKEKKRLEKEKEKREKLLNQISHQSVLTAQ